MLDDERFPTFAALMLCAVNKAQTCLRSMCVRIKSAGHMLLRRVGREGGGGRWGRRGGGYLPALTQHSPSMKEKSCEPCIRKLCFCQPSMLCNHGDVTFPHGFIGVRVCICILWRPNSSRRCVTNQAQTCLMLWYQRPVRACVQVTVLCCQSFDTSHAFRRNTACVFKCPISQLH